MIYGGDDDLDVEAVFRTIKLKPEVYHSDTDHERNYHCPECNPQSARKINLGLATLCVPYSSPNADPHGTNYSRLGSDNKDEHRRCMNEHCKEQCCAEWLPLKAENQANFAAGFTIAEKVRYSHRKTDDLLNPHYSVTLQSPINERYEVTYEVLDFPYTYFPRARRHEVPNVEAVKKITGLHYTYNQYIYI